MGIKEDYWNLLYSYYYYYTHITLLYIIRL